MNKKLLQKFDKIYKTKTLLRFYVKNNELKEIMK